MKRLVTTAHQFSTTIANIFNFGDSTRPQKCIFEVFLALLIF